MNRYFYITSEVTSAMQKHNKEHKLKKRVVEQIERRGVPKRCNIYPSMFLKIGMNKKVTSINLNNSKKKCFFQFHLHSFKFCSYFT